MWEIQRVLLYLSVLLIITCGDQNENITKLELKIFYESLCPDSRSFILNQLIPVMDKMGQYIHVIWLPFGKSTSLDNGKRFICQHGSAECKGNRIMSCTFSKMTDQMMQVNYVACFMQIFGKFGKTNRNEYGRKCVDDVLFEKIMGCYQSLNGTRYQLQAEVHTKEVIGNKSDFIPTIVINDNYDQNVQDKSLKDLYAVVCSMIKQTYPNAC